MVLDAEGCCLRPRSIVFYLTPIRSRALLSQFFLHLGDVRQHIGQLFLRAELYAGCIFIGSRSVSRRQVVGLPRLDYLFGTIGVAVMQGSI